MHDEPPGKRPFYKYASPETTLAILRQRTIRYSSPLTFNDPFDVQSGLHFDFDLASLPGLILDKIGELATAQTEPNVDPADPWGQLVLETRKHFRSHGFPRDRWRPLFLNAFDSLNKVFEETRAQFQDHWTSVLLPGVRVFCVSEERDNLLMWAHYAKEHKGAVFEFWSLPEEDNPLSVAKAVKYVDSPPSFFSEAEFVEDILSLNKFNVSDLSRRYVYSKSTHWAHENEWRVWYPLSTTALHDDMPIRQNEFIAIYIGCRATNEFRADVRDIVKSNFNTTKIFQAIKREEIYALEYIEV